MILILLVALACLLLCEIGKEEIDREYLRNSMFQYGILKPTTQAQTCTTSTPGGQYHGKSRMQQRHQRQLSLPSRIANTRQTPLRRNNVRTRHCVPKV